MITVGSLPPVGTEAVSLRESSTVTAAVYSGSGPNRLVFVRAAHIAGQFASHRWPRLSLGREGCAAGRVVVEGCGEDQLSPPYRLQGRREAD